MQDQQKPFSRGKCATLVCMAMLIGLTTATQLFAWRFQYQDALGFNLYHVYFPWMFLEWAATWYPKYLNWFIGCGSAGVVVTSILLIILTMRQIVTVNSGNGNEFLHGSARWAAKEDIEKAGLFSENGVYVEGGKIPRPASSTTYAIMEVNIFCVLRPLVPVKVFVLSFPRFSHGRKVASSPT